MNKAYLKLLLIVGVLVSLMIVLNISVTTRKGVDFNVYEIKLPLYLKILDFVGRHYNYKNLVVNIIGDTKNENAKTVKIFDWLISNVRKNPKELPVIDDHPLNILIRGYGTADQFEDIFTILCTYAGMEAFFQKFTNHFGNIYYISFVKINGRWCPLSSFAGVYSTESGAISSVDSILADQALLSPFVKSLANFETNTFLKEISIMDFKSENVRIKGQSPMGRVLCFIKNMLGRMRGGR